MKRVCKVKWPTAIHEAGHAIINCYFRLRMREVSIVPNKQKNAAGYVEWVGDPRYANQEEVVGTWSTALREMNAATAALGGRAAVEAICPSHSTGWHYATDERIVLEAYGWSPTVLKEDYQEYLTWRNECLDRARRIVREPRVKRAIIILADALLRQKTISGEDASGFLPRGRMPLDERRFRQRVVRRETRARRKRAKQNVTVC